MASSESNRPVAYRLQYDAMEEIYTIERVETIGPFLSREAARQHMIATTEERKLRDEYGVTVESALVNVEKAARELDALFDGDPDGWRLGGRLILNADVYGALLSLHDYLNDVTVARAARGPSDSAEWSDEHGSGALPPLPGEGALMDPPPAGFDPRAADGR